MSRPSLSPYALRLLGVKEEKERVAPTTSPRNGTRHSSRKKLSPYAQRLLSSSPPSPQKGKRIKTQPAKTSGSTTTPTRQVAPPPPPPGKVPVTAKKKAPTPPAPAPPATAPPAPVPQAPAVVRPPSWLTDTAASLETELKKRKSVKDLGAVLLHDPSKVHGKNAATMRKLEKAMKSDVIEKNLRTRTDRGDLHKTGVIPEIHADPSKIAPKLVAAAHQLDKQMKKDNLSKNLKKRPSIDALHAGGHLPTNYNPTKRNSVTATTVHIGSKLEKNMKKDALHRSLKLRPTIDDLHNKGIIDPDHHITNIGRSLAPAARDLSNAMKRDALSKAMLNRKPKSVVPPTVLDPLHHKHVMDPKLAKTSKELARNMTKDQLHQKLRARPDVDEMHQKGYLEKNHVMRGEGKSTEQRLEEHLLTRPSKVDLKGKNVLKDHHPCSDPHPTIAAAGQALEMKMRQDGLHKHIRRLSATHGKELAQRLGYVNPEHSNIDPSLLSTTQKLETKMKADQLHKNLRERASKCELESMGVFTPANPLNDKYESKIAPRNGKPMDLTSCLDEVRHAIFNIKRFRRYLDTLDDE